MKIKLDEAKCVAGGQCVMAAPDVFDQRDEDGVAVLLHDEPTDAEVPGVRRAVILCPAAALELTGD